MAFVFQDFRREVFGGPAEGLGPAVRAGAHDVVLGEAEIGQPEVA